MKNRKLLYILSFLLLSVFIGTFFYSKTVYAACDFAKCGIPPDCTLPDCSSCCVVGVPSPSGGTDINCENKIHNTALSSLLCSFNGPEFLQTILSTFISLGVVVGSLTFFFMIMLGGIKWINSGGDKSHLETAQKQISSGITGLAILLSIFAIIKVVEVIFGISILTFTLPRLGN